MLSSALCLAFPQTAQAMRANADMQLPCTALQVVLVEHLYTQGEQCSNSSMLSHATISYIFTCSPLKMLCWAHAACLVCCCACRTINCEGGSIRMAQTVLSCRQRHSQHSWHMSSARMACSLHVIRQQAGGHSKAAKSPVTIACLMLVGCGVHAWDAAPIGEITCCMWL
jgi:hypothetical protein